MKQVAFPDNTCHNQRLSRKIHKWWHSPFNHLLQWVVPEKIHTPPPPTEEIGNTPPPPLRTSYTNLRHF